jgi:hypothetical protein
MCVLSIVEGSDSLDAKPIEVYDISLRVYSCLKRAGVNTDEDVHRMSMEDLMRVRNLGRQRISEIIEKFDLHFDEDGEPVPKKSTIFQKYQHELTVEKVVEIISRDECGRCPLLNICDWSISDCKSHLYEYLNQEIEI